jgi:hypothetical protein
VECIVSQPYQKKAEKKINEKERKV